MSISQVPFCTLEADRQVDLLFTVFSAELKSAKAEQRRSPKVVALLWKPDQAIRNSKTEGEIWEGWGKD